jgi:hypothetical protein
MKRTFSSVFTLVIVVTLLLPLYAAAQTQTTPRPDSGQPQLPGPINILLLRNSTSADPALDEGDVVQSDRERYRTFTGACDRTGNGVNARSSGSDYVSCPGQAEGASPSCARFTLYCGPAPASPNLSATPESASSNDTDVTGTAAPSSFVPLTNLPGLSASSDTLPTFFNNLYKLCIGAAAVIAILQIMRAGTYFFFNKGSVAHNVKAKELIMNSVLGLLLVLSPAIIFGIINPDILHLNLDVSRLRTSLTPRLPSLTPGEAAAACQVTISGDQSSCMSTETSAIRPAYAGCISSHGDSAATRQTCGDQAESAYNRAAAKCFTSPALNSTQLSCMSGKFDFTGDAPPRLRLGNPTQSEVCDQTYGQVIAASNAQQCTASRGVHLEASNGCCSGVSSGAYCCGLPHPPPDPIDVITLGTRSGANGSVGLSDIPQSEQLKYTGFVDRCIAVSGTTHLALATTRVSCPNPAAGAAPQCVIAHLRCELP